MFNLDSIPPVLLGLGIIALLSIIIELGFRLGKKLGAEGGLSKHPVEASVTTAILSLMAFMLGFSFASASSKFSARRDLALADNNAAGTLYLRTSFLPPEKIEPARDYIREYVKIRMEATNSKDMEEIEAIIKKCGEIQSNLWSLAEEARKESSNVSLNLFITSLNEVIDIDAERRAKALVNRFPPTLWYTLAFLCALSTSMLGVSSGLHGKRSRLASTALIVAFSVVIVLIVDLDRPIRKFFSEGDAIGEDTLRSMTP